MSNKLTKKKIDLLIEQVLQEKNINVKIPGLGKNDKNKINTADDNFHKEFGYSVPKLNKTEFEDLSAEDGSPTNFTPTDLYNAFLDTTGSTYDDAQKFLKGKRAYKITADRAKQTAEKVKSQDVQDVENIDAFDPATPTKVVSADDIKSMAFKKLQTIAADPADESTNLGSFPEGLATAVNVVFKGINNFKGRIEKISELTKLVYRAMPRTGWKGNANEIQKSFIKESDLLATVLFLDYVTTVVKEIDSGAAAYEFESMLALLSGGRVTGKQTTASGKMAATDFVTNKGVNGSAKYYGRVGYSSIKQAPLGFDMNVPYIYIIAHKKADSRSTAITTGTSDPREIAAVDLYLLSVITPNGKDFVIRNPNGDLIYRQASKSYVYLGGEETMVNPITLYVEKETNESKSFRQQLLGDIGQNLEINQGQHEAALVAYNQISKYSYVADEKLKSFMTTGEDGAGNEALKAMMQMEQGIEKIAPIFNSQYSAQITKGLKGGSLKENKTKSLKELDKLIEHVILNKINK
jgi:hypothetical protein